MPEESTTHALVELAALFRTNFPDGTDIAHVAHDDAAWATFTQALAALLAPDFVYEDSAMPDHAGEAYRGLIDIDEARAAADPLAEERE